MGSGTGRMFRPYQADLTLSLQNMVLSFSFTDASGIDIPVAGLPRRQAQT
jgi:hypothetical protein